RAAGQDPRPPGHGAAVAAGRLARRPAPPAFLAGRDGVCWGFALPWLLDTAERFPRRLAPFLAP
ncbi:MAG TPA: hypothetical protein VEY96_04210, partial [Actinomycetes bacterium]|nr:hypothetical protein [Actinomycetes bacterium]